MPFRWRQRAHPVRRNGGVVQMCAAIATLALASGLVSSAIGNGALAQPTKSEKPAPKSKPSAKGKTAAAAEAKSETKGQTKSQAKAESKAKSKSPPLPSPSPRRVADVPSPTDDEKDEASARPTKSLAAVPPALPNSPEATYFAEMDKLIAPLRDFKPSSEDIQRLRDALKAVDSNDPADARTHAAKISDPTASTLVTWYALRSGIGAPSDYAKFLTENSNVARCDSLEAPSRAATALGRWGGQGHPLVLQHEPTALGRWGDRTRIGTSRAW